MTLPKLQFSRITAVVLFGMIAGSVHADPLGANTGVLMRLQDSTFQEGCFEPCMCPIMAETPVLGTMRITYAGVADGEHAYEVRDVSWVLPNTNAATHISGTGKYRIGTPGPNTVVQHRLELDLQVDSASPAHFDSGWRPYTGGSGIELAISINNMFCWDRVIRINAQPILSTQVQRFSLDVGSTFQRGCIDGLCDCAVGPQVPMHGVFALVLLQENPLFRIFSVLDVQWQVMNANTVSGIPIRGAGIYWVGGEVALQNRLAMSLRVADESAQRYDSGMVVGGVQFPQLDIVTRTHTDCVDTLLHVVASPDGGSGDICGGIAGFPCGEGEFCHLAPGECCCDFQGICTSIPQNCPEYYDPVCGCDGMTYSNPCFAAMAGQSIDYWGACRTLCGPNSLPCPSNNEFCKFSTGSCGTTTEPGICTPYPAGCPDVWDPVCGCNGITYGNECEADAAGVSVLHGGLCEDPCQPTPDGFGCTSCFSAVPEDVCRPAVLHLDVHTGAITTSDCNCELMGTCHIEFGNASPFAVGNCPTGQTCEVVRRDSDNDGIDDTFWARCMSEQVGPCCFDIDDGPIRYDTCLSRTETACEIEGGIFAGTNVGCEATQSCCFADTNICADLYPTCCVASNGQPGGPGSSCPTTGCGQVCGGIAGIPCDSPDEFCKLPIGQCCCDHFGTCTQMGENCPTVWEPVCGCDGQTYGNECEADAAGASISHRGPCGSPNCPATRVLTHPNSPPCAGNSNLVRILLSPPNSAAAIAVEESLPAGWSAGNISNAGQYDAVHHKVKWGPFFPPFPSDLSYSLNRTANAATAPCLSGMVSVDGVNEATCGETCFSPCCPQMAADQPHDACADCPVTDCNSCNASVCGDSRIHMCEIVGYACSWLHGCHDDLAGMTRAAFVWRTGECYCWDGANDTWNPASCSDVPTDHCCDNANRPPFEIIGSSATLTTTASGRGTKSSRGDRRVWIDVEVPTTAMAVALELKIPKGLTVGHVSDGGVWDAAARTIRWGVFFEDLSRTVTFTVSRTAVKSAAARNSVSEHLAMQPWHGILSVDGINQPIQVQP